MNVNGFVRREVQGVPYYSCCAFEKLTDLRHGFSTRHGGVSCQPEGSLNLSHVSWDSPERVQENRRRLLSALRLQGAQLATLRQVHSNRVHIIKENSGEWNPPEGDALATQQEGVALAVQVADCLPVLITDPLARAVGAVHSGWRGMLSRVLLKTVEEMRKEFGSDPAHLLVAVGPGIRACCFEVGPEVAALFDKEYPRLQLKELASRGAGKYLLDLRKALDIQFEDTGIAPQNVYDLGACTRCNPQEFFSYRAEGPRSGRMMAAIAKTSRQWAAGSKNQL